MICPTLMKVAPSSRKRSRTTCPNQSRRRAFPEKRTQSASDPTQKRTQCLPTSHPMRAARAARRLLDKDLAGIPGILYYVRMGAPPQPAVTSPLREDEPATAVDMWKRRVAAMPDRVAFRHWSPAGGRWVALTWKEADATAREIAGGLVARGVVPGDRVCVLAQTSLEWILADVGILLAGGVTVPIYPSSTAEQCEFIVRDSGSKLIILEDAAQLEKILSVRDHLLTVTSIVHMAGDAKLEKADARGRSVVTLAEVTEHERGLTDLALSLDGLRAAGRTWLAAHAGEL